MVIVMDNGTGKRVCEPEDNYGDEVLFSNWLPQPEIAPRLQEAVPSRRKEPPLDAEAFLRAVYLSQE